MSVGGIGAYGGFGYTPGPADGVDFPSFEIENLSGHADGSVGLAGVFVGSATPDGGNVYGEVRILRGQVAFCRETRETGQDPERALTAAEKQQLENVLRATVARGGEFADAARMGLDALR